MSQAEGQKGSEAERSALHRQLGSRIVEGMNLQR